MLQRLGNDVFLLGNCVCVFSQTHIVCQCQFCCTNVLMEQSDRL